MDICKVKSKVLYWSVINHKLVEPTAIDTWIDLYSFLDIFPWYKIFKLAHCIVPETYLHTFQYKILHRLLNCNYNLNKWKLKDNPNCLYCKRVDTIEHHLFDCELNLAFWDRVKTWLAETLGICNEQKYSVCEILFGYNIQENGYSEDSHVQNIIILLGKLFINKTRVAEKTVNVTEFLRYFRPKLELYYSSFNLSDSAGVAKQSQIAGKIKRILDKI